MTTFDLCKLALNSETYKLLIRDPYRYDAPLSPEAAWLEASRNLEYRTQSKDGEYFDSIGTWN
jgi:hypothetical protein